jgi:heme/copper-type cytochrome/quinol oxidase subunit 2
MRQLVWFEAMETGTYTLGCAELCGMGHYRMRGTVTVHDGAAFDSWQQSSGEAAFADDDDGDARVADAAGTPQHDEHSSH